MASSSPQSLLTGEVEAWYLRVLAADGLKYRFAEPDGRVRRHGVISGDELAKARCHVERDGATDSLDPGSPDV